MTPLDILLPGRTLPERWIRQHWRGADRPHIGQRWDAPDPDLPHHQQRRCHAEVWVADDGTAAWRLDVDDGPTQYFAWTSGTHATADGAVEAAEAAAAAWLAEPVAYPRLLRCPQSGRPCAEGPCRTPWSGCDGVRP